MTVRFIVSQTPTPTVDGDKDDSSYDRTFTLVGESNPTFNENSKIGSATLKFIGNDQKLTTPANANLDIGTTFTIDFWMRFDPFYLSTLQSNGGGQIISNHEGGGEVQEQGYEIGINGIGHLSATYWYDTGKGVSSAVISATDAAAIVTDGAWHHVCLQRGTEGESNVMRLFVDGVSYANTSSQSTFVHNTVTANPFTIGARASVSPTIELPFLYGTIDELEIIDGVAKFATGGFTPPTTANTSTANHLLLMHFDSSNPTPTVWYDSFDNNYWSGAGNNYNWTGTLWNRTGSPAALASQYDWYPGFRPEQIKVTGTLAAASTITMRDGSEGILGSATAATTVTMQLSFTDHTTTYDMRYFRGLEAFDTITNIQFDAKSITPTPS